MSIAGVMQPYFFPYIGYYQMASKCDLWVVFDDIQYIDKGWISRNRILHPDPNKEWSYISLPLSKPNMKLIKDINISHHENFQNVILGKLTHYKKLSSHYKHEIKFVEELLSYSSLNLSDFLTTTLSKMFQHLEIDAKVILQRDTGVAYSMGLSAGEWALKICEHVNAATYINPISGRDLFDSEQYLASNINLKFFIADVSPYPQRRSKFIPGLSILDLLLLHGRKFVIEQTKLGSYCD